MGIETGKALAAVVVGSTTAPKDKGGRRRTLLLLLLEGWSTRTRTSCGGGWFHRRTQKKGHLGRCALFFLVTGTQLAALVVAKGIDMSLIVEDCHVIGSTGHLHNIGGLRIVRVMVVVVVVTRVVLIHQRLDQGRYQTGSFVAMSQLTMIVLAPGIEQGTGPRCRVSIATATRRSGGRRDGGRMLGAGGNLNHHLALQGSLQQSGLQLQFVIQQTVIAAMSTGKVHVVTTKIVVHVLLLLFLLWLHMMMQIVVETIVIGSIVMSGQFTLAPRINLSLIRQGEGMGIATGHLDNGVREGYHVRSWHIIGRIHDGPPMSDGTATLRGQTRQCGTQFAMGTTAPGIQMTVRRHGGIMIQPRGQLQDGKR